MVIPPSSFSLFSPSPPLPPTSSFSFSPPLHPFSPSLLPYTLFLLLSSPTPVFSPSPPLHPFSPLLPNTLFLLFYSHEKNHKVLEHLLASLNIFSTVAAVNARGRLCKLGEDIFHHILHLWSKCQPALKDQVVEFLRIQIRVHHPRGTHTDEEGAWATNDDLWKVWRITFIAKFSHWSTSIWLRQRIVWNVFCFTF